MDGWKRIGGRIAVAIVACGVFAAPARAEDDIDRVLQEGGKVRYQQYCTACHGPDGAPGKSKADLRTYVARHGGKFPAADWLAVIADTRPASPHTAVWERIRNDQLNTSGDVAARGVVGQIARYVMSIQSQ
jgi:mono/diheme cytochrome c family protein